MPHIQHPKRFVFIALLVACSAGLLLTPHQPVGRNPSSPEDAAINPPDTSHPLIVKDDSVEVLSAAGRELGGSGRALVSDSYGKLPLSFEANSGRFDGRVKYVSRGRGYGLFLTPTEAVLTLRPAGGPTPSNADDGTATRGAEAAVLHMRPVGASRKVRLEGFAEQPGKSNYFIGDDPSKWRTNVAHYAGVRYRQIYPGIDLVYHGRQRQLEYDFEVAPGADPGVIRVAFKGARKMSLSADGDLVLLLPGGGEIRQHRPVVYQEADGRRVEVAGRYVLRGEREVGFEVGGYDPSRPLVIDPVLSYASYLGGSRVEEGHGIAVDSFGNAYVVGLTESADFPTVNYRPPGNDTQDVFVTKINPSGSAMVYSTYLGGSGTDRGFGVAVDSSGNAYVTGFTSSNDFPTEAPIPGSRGEPSFRSDAFVTKLSPEGSTLVYSTYLGGRERDEGHGIAVDSAGAAYVVGDTDSPDFPTANAAQPKSGSLNIQGDAFVTKLNPAGSAFVYSTFIGGGDYEQGRSIAVDSTGSAYVTGATHSTDFPTANHFQPNLSNFCSGGGRIAECLEAFVTKLNPAGSAFVYSTYLGGGLRDEGHGIAVDSSGNAYVAGQTSSSNFPITAGAFQPTLSEPNNGPFFPDSDAFVTKLNAAGTALVYSTYLGGIRFSEHVGGIAVAADGSAYVAGLTGSETFPVADALQPRYAGGGDAFVTKLNPAGSALVYSTYFGGTRHDGATAIALDSAGNAYLTGHTDGGFPVEKPFQPAHGGGDLRDAFVAKIGDAPIQPPTALAISAVTPGRGGNSGSVTVSLHGSGFKSGATVKLTRAGQPDITAASVGVSEDSFIARARFDLSGHAPGLRDVVLTNPDGRSVTRAAAFNVELGGQPRPWVDIVGRDAIRPGRPQTYYITYGNRGNVDAVLLPIVLSMPKDATYELGFELMQPAKLHDGPPLDFSQIPPHVTTETKKLLPLLVPFVPVGKTGVLKIRITSQSVGELELVTRVSVPGGIYAAVSVPNSRRQTEAAVCAAAADYEPGPFGPDSRIVECFATASNLIIERAIGTVPGGECVLEKMKELAYKGMNDTVTQGIDIANGTFDAYDGVSSTVQTLASIVPPGAKCLGKEAPGAAQIYDAVKWGLVVFDIGSDCFPVVGEVFKRISSFFSRDPNDKVGSAGAGQGRYLSGEEPLRYAVFFENKSEANAPAQDVVVTDQLDAANLDFDTFSLGPISFGKDRLIVPPPGLSEFRKDVDLRPSNNLIVRVEAKLEKATGLLTWRFTSLDPATGQPTEDPTAGFLPPNKNAPEGEGQVLFTVQPRKHVATGTEVRNKARIVFDANAPIDTPEWFNTIDNSPPASRAGSLAAAQPSVVFDVTWAGTDAGSGVRDYTVFVSEGGGPYTIWLERTTQTSATFVGRPQKTYSFYTLATDNAGNQEAAKTAAEATTATRTDIANAVDDTRFFVRQQYLDFLSREPDQSGWAHWTNVIESCGADAQCREVHRINVSGAFFLSIEFRETGYLVERTYKAAYGDATGTSALNGTHQLQVPIVRFEEFLPDTQRISRGVVVLAPGWEEQLEANKVAFFQEFVQRQRFLDSFPLSMSPTDFVNRLNGRAGGPLDAAERLTLINELTANNTAEGRASVLRKVAEDPTLDAAERNRAFVLMQYFGYLRRNPNSGQDTDHTGYDFWLGNLEKFNGNFVQAELVKAFISSIEYRQRFGQ